MFYSQMHILRQYSMSNQNLSTIVFFIQNKGMKKYFQTIKDVDWSKFNKRLT